MEENYKNKEIRNFHQVARKSREVPQKTLTYLRKKNEELIERTSGGFGGPR
jgi:hypothetical protein